MAKAMRFYRGYAEFSNDGKPLWGFLIFQEHFMYKSKAKWEV